MPNEETIVIDSSKYITITFKQNTSTYKYYYNTIPRTSSQGQVVGRSAGLLVDVNTGLSLLVLVSVFLRVRVRLVRGVAGLYRTGPPRSARCAGPAISLGGRSLVTLRYLVLVLGGAPGLSRGR